MGLENFSKGAVIDRVGDTASTIRLLLKGTVSLVYGGSKMRLTQGSLLGLSVVPGGTYNFSYVAEDDVTVFTYPYAGEESIQKVIESNAKIAPALAVKAVQNTLNAFYGYDSFYESVSKVFEKIKGEYSDYPINCKKAGVAQGTFPELDEMDAPERTGLLQDWQVNYLETLKENEKQLMTGYYSMSTNISTGTVLLMGEMQQKIEEGLSELAGYKESLEHASADFEAELQHLQMKLNAVKQTMVQSGESEAGADVEVPLIRDAMDIILSYSGLDKNKCLALKEFIKQYKELPDRRNTTDPVRRLRKQLTDNFFDLYLACYLKSRENPMNIPVEVRMFLFFGFFDEELAGPQNTEIMYRIITSYRPDPEGHVFTLYQWLTMVQDGAVQPSRNEFEQDYEGFMREQRDRGDITDAEYEKNLKDPTEKLKYEIHNIFMMGNRMTFGKVSSYQPFFDSDNVLMELDKAYMSPETVNGAINAIKEIDKSIFRREREYRNEEIGIRSMLIHAEVIPRIILFPNVGTRAALWQEIEGKRRDSSARMIMPVFLTEELMKAFTNLCGEYRWEIIKTEQGVHWNDLKDLSLTSEYNDYIQFYRKNRELNAEQKEKLKKQIQKAGSNLRRTFVSDYLVYINSESNGSPLMNKVARRILFTYCPFSKDIRAKLTSIPLYSNELNKFETKKEERKRPIENVLKKLENAGEKGPQELYDEVEYLES